MESAWTKRKSAAPAKWLVQRFAFCTLGVLALSIYALVCRFSQGQGDRGSRKSYSHTLLHNPAPAALWGALAHFRIVEEGCTEQSAADGPYWAFRLASQPSDWFADPSFLMVRNFPHFIIPPPPIKNQGVRAKFVNIHKFVGFFRPF